MKPTAAFFWRKLDHPGHDSCRLFELPDGWRLVGAAVFYEGLPCHLQYDVVTDARWRTLRADVAGYLGDAAIDLRIGSAGAARWRVNGLPADQADGCIDVDLGFTPATNLIALRRLSLQVGEQAETPAAYLEFPSMRLVSLPQSYRRISDSEYAYQSPTFAYSGVLTVSPCGAIVRYPRLFELLSSDRPDSPSS